MKQAILDAEEAIAHGKPIAYLTNEAFFYDHSFYVDEAVLIPRPDTERLCEKAIARLPKGAVFADLGTGSGCIALTVLCHRPDTRAIAVDLSPEALGVARRNAETLGLLDRVTFTLGDMRQAPLQDKTVEFILSNPPYIPTEDIARYPSLAYEPQMALDGGKDGLDFYRSLLVTLRNNLSPGGGFLFEIGFDQGEAMRNLAIELGYSVEIFKDYGKNDRVALLYPIENPSVKGRPYENSGF